MRVFRFIYEHGRVTNQHISQELVLSRPTVSKALSHLQDAGLVTKVGTFSSSGGRPASAYGINLDAHYAIGIELVADKVRIAFVDLYGNIIATSTQNLSFERTDEYVERIVGLIEQKATEGHLTGRHLVGATIAIQGIVEHGRRVTFGGLLGDDGAKVVYEDFSRHMDFPLRLIHDAEAAAYAEAWRHRDLQDFAYLSLNDHLGSALIRGGKLLQHDHFGAGIAEHMTIIPNGTLCYCGNHGCFETVLGAKSLETCSHMSIEHFFDQVRANDARAMRVWDSYLEYLTLMIHNLRMTACGNIVIGGRLASFLTQEDLRILRMKVTDKGTLSVYPFHLARGHYGNMATVIGAGIMAVNEYFQQSNL